MTKQPSLFDVLVKPKLEEARADYLRRAREAAVRLARRNGEITINDVRAECPPPEGVDPRVMGAVLSTRQFECVGYRRSGRAECHNRPIGVFVLAT